MTKASQKIKRTIEPIKLRPDEIAFWGRIISKVKDPEEPQDVATKNYVDENAGGGGTTYTAGDNITIQNNIISATDTTYNDFEGTDGTSNGTAGLVPAPSSNQTGKYLKSNGNWEDLYVTNTNIASKTIQTGNLADECISNDKLAENAVTTQEIADAAITTAKIGDNQITADKLASNAVTNDKITNNTIEASKIKFTTYSSSEEEIGKWHDGKTLYRKTYSGTSLSEGSSSWYVKFSDSANLNLINAYGILTTNAGNIVVGQTVWSTTNTIQFTSRVEKSTDTYITFLAAKSSGVTVNAYDITIEYTKTNV